MPLRAFVVVATIGIWLALPHPAGRWPAAFWLVAAGMGLRLAAGALLRRRRGGRPSGRWDMPAAATDLALVLAWVWVSGGAASPILPLLAVGVLVPLRLPVRQYAALEAGFLLAALAVTAGRAGMLVLYLAVVAAGLAPWVRRAFLLRLQVDTDPLTGAFNHGYMQARLERELAVAVQRAQSLGLLYVDVDGFKLFNDTYGHPMGDVVLQRIVALLQRACPPGAAVGRMGGDEFLLALPRLGMREVAAVAERVRASVQAMNLRRDNGVRVDLTVSLGPAVFPEDGSTVAKLVAAADVNLYRAKRRGGNAVGAQVASGREQLEDDPVLAALASLAAALAHKDHSTAMHTEEVAEMSRRIAIAMGVAAAALPQLRIGALLHDVGKIGLPDAIVGSPRPLSPEERRIMRRHPELGYLILKEIGGLREALDIVLHHHERYDGQGYPHGLRGEEISLLTRIVCVADAFSAMTSDRPYRARLEREAALAELRAGAGGQFDPAVVATLCALVADPQMSPAGPQTAEGDSALGA